MNSDEVFKAWEENMKIGSEEKEMTKNEQRSTKHSITFPTLTNGGQGVRKNASLYEKRNEMQNGMRTAHFKKMQRVRFI